jgi:ElaB/YqjD/DUF883 family membrane-anchored ribosome-binding protein
MAKSTLESASAEALRTIDEVRSLLEGATAENLAERAAAVKEKLEASREALEGDARPLGQALLSAEQSVREELEEVEQRVRDNPLGSLLAAAGVGVLLGLLLSRQR